MKKLMQRMIALLGISLLLAGQAQAAATVTFYHHDALGSVVASSNDRGWVQWNEEYQPYGEKIYDTIDTAGNGDDWYTGKNYDRDLDLTYFGARWYDAKQGRFLSMDPVGVSLENVHTFNRYAYASDNPYTFVDPDGRAPKFSGKRLFEIQSGPVRQRDIPIIEVGVGPKLIIEDGSGFGGGGRLPSFLRPSQLGKQGESAASKITGVGKNTQKFNVNGRNRIPDQVNASNVVTRKPLVLTEVKNTKYQSFTQQLRDFADLVGPGGRVDLFVRGNGGTKISAPLRAAHEDPTNPINIVPEL